MMPKLPRLPQESAQWQPPHQYQCVLQLCQPKSAKNGQFGQGEAAEMKAVNLRLISLAEETSTSSSAISQLLVTTNLTQCAEGRLNKRSYYKKLLYTGLSGGLNWLCCLAGRSYALFLGFFKTNLFEILEAYLLILCRATFCSMIFYSNFPQYTV